MVTAAALLTAYVLYRFVERPAQAWLRPRLRDALDRIRTMEPARPKAEAPAVETAAAPEPEPAVRAPESSVSGAV